MNLLFSLHPGKVSFEFHVSSFWELFALRSKPEPETGSYRSGLPFPSPHREAREELNTKKAQFHVSSFEEGGQPHEPLET